MTKTREEGWADAVIAGVLGCLRPDLAGCRLDRAGRSPVG
jgi:hypothetical protein